MTAQVVTGELDPLIQEADGPEERLGAVLDGLGLPVAAGCAVEELVSRCAVPANPDPVEVDLVLGHGDETAVHRLALAEGEPVHASAGAATVGQHLSHDIAFLEKGVNAEAGVPSFVRNSGS